MSSAASLRSFWISAAICALFAVPLTAQTGLGVVRGTVQDASKAVIPNAKASLNNTATGVARITTTNADGIYHFEVLPWGPTSWSSKPMALRSGKAP